MFKNLFPWRLIGVHPMLVLLLVVTVSSPTSALDEPGQFRGVSLGAQVLDYQPIDVDGDGIGEIAVHTRIPAVRYSAFMSSREVDAYGIYSPASGQWVVEPTPLGEGIRAWTVTDAGQCGLAEFLFADSAGVHSFNANTGVRQDLWSFPFAPENVYFWGQGSEGQPLVALNRQYEYSYDEPPPSIFSRYTSQWTVEVYDAVSGDPIQSYPSGPPPTFVMPNVALRDQSYLALGQKYYRAEQSDLGGYEEQHDTLRVYDDGWHLIVKCPYPTAAAYPFTSVNRPLSHAIGARTSRNDLVTLSWFTGNRGWITRTIYAHLDGELAWTYSAGNRQYTGAALYDILTRGVVDCILVPANGSDWEILDGETGSLIETLPNMPTVALTTQSLFTRGVSDLYYISHDSLYIWEPIASPFQIVSLGQPVSSAEPIDVEDDGVWEFAVKTATSPPQYGVYSFAARKWIDGPRTLPRAPSAWSANDYDGDGMVEYAYQQVDSIRMYDPVTATDSTLWLLSGPSFPYVVFWGKDGSGRFLLAERANGTGTFGFVTTYDLVVRDLMTGDRGRTLKSVILSPFDLIPDFPEPHQIGRVFVYQSIDCDPTPHVGHCNTVVQPYIVGPDWQTKAVANFANVTYQYNGPPDGYFGIQVATVKTSDPWQTRFIALGLPITSTYMQAKICSFGGPIGPLCTSPSLDWDLRRGFWLYDLDEDGRSDLIIPRKDNAGWELRDPYTLSLRSVVEELPSIHVSTGPVRTADQYDMFYFQGDSLYVGNPAAFGVTQSMAPSSTLHDFGTAETREYDASEDECDALPKTFDFRAYPNPFNSSVRFAWPELGEPARFEILNILGQRVRSLGVGTGVTSIEWDAHDDLGQQVPSGVYFARLVGQKATATVKIVLLK